MSLVNNQEAKELWIAQVSLAFSRCEGYYKSEFNGEIEMSLNYGIHKGINIILRSIPHEDSQDLYDAFVCDKYMFIEELKCEYDHPIHVIDLYPGAGFACLLLSRKFENLKISVIGKNMNESFQLERIFKMNRIENYSVYTLSNLTTTLSTDEQEIEKNNLNKFDSYDDFKNLTQKIYKGYSYKIPTIIILNALQADNLLDNYEAEKNLANQLELIVIDLLKLDNERSILITDRLIQKITNLALPFSYRNGMLIIQAFTGGMSLLPSLPAI